MKLTVDKVRILFMRRMRSSEGCRSISKVLPSLE